MAFYAIFDTDIFDPQAYEEYKVKVGPGIAAHGGKYLSRGGELAVIEGNWDLHRIVMLEFPDKASFTAWYESADYAPLKALRERTVRTNAFTFAGLDASDA